MVSFGFFSFFILLEYVPLTGITAYPENRVQATLSDSKRARSLSPLKCASHSQAFCSLIMAHNGQLCDDLHWWKLDTHA
ncbi:hypothetical protein EV361DRAFT_878210 [Lentinula raphanica]|nr:hypothetical protein EV361DRAFT_878210 [Lentinula raphanica]